MSARIKNITYYLPPGTLTNADLSSKFPEWSVEKIASKTGINVRHIAAPEEFSSDLGIAAGKKLFAEGKINPAIIDFLIS